MIKQTHFGSQDWSSAACMPCDLSLITRMDSLVVASSSFKEELESEDAAEGHPFIKEQFDDAVA